MAPKGVTTFVSASWGGRVSDKQLTSDSGSIQKLLSRDIVLADRGFNIAEDPVMVQAILQILDFTKGVSQYTPIDIEQTRKLVNLRIHVEHIIGTTMQTVLFHFDVNSTNSFCCPKPQGCSNVELYRVHQMQ